MKAEFLNPFLRSIVEIIASTISETPQKGKIFLRDKNPYMTQDVAIMVGITGTITGQIVLSLTDRCARGIAAVMLMEEEVPALDEYAQSALAEMANMITANATIGLGDAGYVCDITPPSVITGKQMEISCRQQIKTIVIPLDLSMGHLEVNLSLIESAEVKNRD
jgi:chemotaxis protein CheX